MKNQFYDSVKKEGCSLTYYAHARPEIAALVPVSCRRIVDVGCGAGELGALLKRVRPQVEVRGIEPVESQAREARTKLDEVYWGKADDPWPENWPLPDCLIFSDVLEHLIDPWKTLNLWHNRLTPGGTLIISIPNVGHKSVVLGLLRGRWNYLREGILDRTHLRFFTRESAIELVREAGFRLLSIESAHSTHWVTRACRRLGKRLRADRSSGFLRFLADLDTTQFVIIAQRGEGPGINSPAEGL